MQILCYTIDGIKYNVMALFMSRSKPSTVFHFPLPVSSSAQFLSCFYQITTHFKRFFFTAWILLYTDNEGRFYCFHTDNYTSRLNDICLHAHDVEVSYSRPSLRSCACSNGEYYLKLRISDIMETRFFIYYNKVMLSVKSVGTFFSVQHGVCTDKYHWETEKHKKALTVHQGQHSIMVI